MSKESDANFNTLLVGQYLGYLESIRTLEEKVAKIRAGMEGDGFTFNEDGSVTLPKTL